MLSGLCHQRLNECTSEPGAGGGVAGMAALAPDQALERAQGILMGDTVQGPRGRNGRESVAMPRSGRV